MIFAETKISRERMNHSVSKFCDEAHTALQFVCRSSLDTMLNDDRLEIDIRMKCEIQKIVGV